MLLVNKKAFFWNLIAKKYAKQPVANEEAYQQKLRQTQEYFTPQSRVFEFGCGTGTTSLYHSSKVKEILAIDISKKMIEIAKDKAEKQKVSNVEFKQSSIEDINLDGETFDVALAMSIFHLVENKDEVLRQLHHTLKPGGKLISSTACIKEAFPALRFFAPVGYALGLLPLIKCFDTFELETSIINAGFKIEKKWRPSLKEATFIVATKI